MDPLGPSSARRRVNRRLVPRVPVSRHPRTQEGTGRAGSTICYLNLVRRLCHFRPFRTFRTYVHRRTLLLHEHETLYEHRRSCHRPPRFTHVLYASLRRKSVHGDHPRCTSIPSQGPIRLARRAPASPSSNSQRIHQERRVSMHRAIVAFAPRAASPATACRVVRSAPL